VAEKEAKYLAMEARQASPDITRVLWFPDDQEVRLVEVTEEVPVYMEEELYPFYFRASPEDDLPLPSGVVMIRPDEVGKFAPPKEWGTWDDAVEL
jgi:hypothetical protein